MFVLLNSMNELVKTVFGYLKRTTLFSNRHSPTFTLYSGNSLMIRHTVCYLWLDFYLCFELANCGYLIQGCLERHLKILVFICATQLNSVLNWELRLYSSLRPNYGLLSYQPEHSEIKLGMPLSKPTPCWYDIQNKRLNFLTLI